MATGKAARDRRVTDTAGINTVCLYSIIETAGRHLFVLQVNFQGVQLILTVVETPLFLRYAKDIWDDEEREVFVQWIAGMPEAGVVIPGTQGLRKVRWSRSGMGKQGGSRVIYFLRRPQGQIVLLLVYAKSKFDNLSTDYLRQLKEICDGS